MHNVCYVCVCVCVCVCVYVCKYTNLELVAYAGDMGARPLHEEVELQVGHWAGHWVGPVAERAEAGRRPEGVGVFGVAASGTVGSPGAGQPAGWLSSSADLCK